MAKRTISRIAKSLILLALSLGAAAPSGGAAPAASREQVICNLLFVNLNAAKGVLGTPDASQIMRIDAILQSLSPEQRKELFAELAKQDLTALAAKAKAGKLDGFEKLFQQQPELANVVLDFVQFGDTFPGIFATSDPEKTVAKVVDLVRTKEAATKLNHPDILMSQAEAPRLRRTLENTLINLIQQADAEYSGSKFGRSGMQNFLYKLKRFFLPTYKRVNELVGWTEANQKQLQKLKVIDELVIRYGLSEERALGLKPAELDKLLQAVLNSPDEIQDIEKLTKRVLGESFATGKEVEIGKFDIYGSHRRMAGIDSEKLYDSFDDINVRSLNALDTVIDDARVRKGQAPRGPREYDRREVQIRYEAAERQAGRAAKRYYDTTAEGSNVTYVVERQRSRQVADGTDEKGNVKYRTEYYMEDETVRPSFERILRDSYDTGDGDVRGLSTVRSQAAAMVKREGGPRSLTNEIDALVSELSENWKYVVTGKGEFAKRQKEVEDSLQKVTAEIERQKSYAGWSKSEILAQYGKDSVENFQARNAHMLEKLHQNRNALEMLGEAMHRQLPELHPIYDLMDSQKWMRNLRYQRNKARTIQTGMGVAAGAGGVVAVSEDAQDFLEEQGVPLHKWVKEGFDTITGVGSVKIRQENLRHDSRQRYRNH